jgi:hypothetical protein
VTWDSSLRTARRATVGVSALGWIALLCLTAAVAFWLALFIDLLAPPQLLSPQMIQALLTVIAFSLVLPLFWSMLLPSSPAGRLLQKQQWATPGYGAVVIAAIFLTYHAWRWSYAWWQAQPNVAESGEALMLAMTSLIAAVLLPALSWRVVTPEQWIAQIEQARHVKRLEHAMQMEEASMRAMYARAVSLLHADLTNLTIEQRRELAGILGTFARVQQQSLQAIARSWHDMYGVEAQLASIPDQQLLDGYQQVANLLAEGGEAMSSSVSYATRMQALAAPPATANERQRSPQTEQRSRTAVEPPDAKTNDRERMPERSMAASPRIANGANVSTANDILAAARRALGASVWTRADLERVLSIQKTKASEYVKAWREAGALYDINDPAYHYQFREVR